MGFNLGFKGLNVILYCYNYTSYAVIEINSKTNTKPHFWHTEISKWNNHFTQKAYEDIKNILLKLNGTCKCRNYTGRWGDTFTLKILVAKYGTHLTICMCFKWPSTALFQHRSCSPLPSSQTTAIIPTIPEDSQRTYIFHGDYKGGE